MINQFKDLMGIVSEPTGNVFIDKIKNKNICYGGGGGGQTSTATSGVPKEFRPYVTRGLRDAETAREAGDLSFVADLTPEQRESQAMQLELGRETLPGIAEDSAAARDVLGQASRGEGIFGSGAYQMVADDMSERLATLGDTARGMSQTRSALGGGLGSARQQAITEKAVMDTMFDEVSKEVDAQRRGRTGAAQNVIGTGDDVGAQFGLGAAAIERVGSMLQQQDQRKGDATYQGLQRFFGLLGSPAVGSETKTTTTGGGK